MEIIEFKQQVDLLLKKNPVKKAFYGQPLSLSKFCKKNKIKTHVLYSSYYYIYRVLPKPFKSFLSKEQINEYYELRKISLELREKHPLHEILSKNKITINKVKDLLKIDLSQNIDRLTMPKDHRLQRILDDIKSLSDPKFKNIPCRLVIKKENYDKIELLQKVKVMIDEQEVELWIQH